MLAQRAYATVAGIVIAVTLGGCPDPNTYSTPRTLAPGDLQIQVSMSGFTGTGRGQTAVSPGLPSVGVRIGLADRLDVGARLSGFSSVQADLKYNFLRGRVDIAIDPMAQAYYYDVSGLREAIGIAQLHLPVLFGVNLDEATTLLFTPGFFAGLSTSPLEGSGASSVQVASLSDGLGARLGLGLNVRVSDKLSWQPEVTVWHQFTDLDAWVCVFGIGLNAGAQPDYSDIGGSETSQ